MWLLVVYCISLLWNSVVVNGVEKFGKMKFLGDFLNNFSCLVNVIQMPICPAVLLFCKAIRFAFCLTKQMDRKNVWTVFSFWTLTSALQGIHLILTFVLFKFFLRISCIEVSWSLIFFDLFVLTFEMSVQNDIMKSWYKH